MTQPINDNYAKKLRELVKARRGLAIAVARNSTDASQFWRPMIADLERELETMKCVF